MKLQLLVITLLIGHLLLSFMDGVAQTSLLSAGGAQPGLKAQAYAILEARCNVCHRKQNPFMVFRLKNMDKRAAKINTQVFVKRRMPKGDKVTLSKEEYATLKKWLNTQIH